MTFQDNLRHYREKAGYSQAKDFAAAIGVKYSTYIGYAFSNKNSNMTRSRYFKRPRRFTHRHAARTCPKMSDFAPPLSFVRVFLFLTIHNLSYG